MPSHQERRTPLPADYVYQPPQQCYGCGERVRGEVVWLGEHAPQCEYAFHPICAEQPWPLYETRRGHI